MAKHAAGGNGNTRDTSAGSKHAATGQGKRDAVQVAKATRSGARVAHAYSAGKRSGGGQQSRGGKPSVARSTVGGAAGGAATGAALGSVVPGVGTAVGAGAGAVVGGAGGALKGRSAKKEWKAAARGDSGGARRALIAEFALCILILALSPLAKGEGEVSPKDWMKRGSAMCGLFLLLGLLSSVGPRTARAATAIGGLITLVLLVDQREIFAAITRTLKTTGQGDADPDSAAAGVGKAAGDAVDQVGKILAQQQAEDAGRALGQGAGRIIGQLGGTSAPVVPRGPVMWT